MTMVPEIVIRDTGQDPPAVATALNGRLRLGGPVSAPVSASYVADDAELKLFVEEKSAQYRYDLVHLALTVTTGPGQDRFETVVIRLRLSADGTQAPIAWSMRPERVTGEAKLSTTWRLGPQLKLFAAGVEHTETKTDGACYLEAQNDLRPDPEWTLHRIRGREISGVHRLTLIVCSPVGTETTLSGAIDATVVRGKRPWREHASLPNLLTLSAVLK
ncbi:hypothetical protein [Catenulispora sp. GP43]|uniref:hypothetical protein n=1 Tax=Catenulispora sp. GP43 TaxID=3156263 RepID=UPI003510F872